MLTMSSHFERQAGAYRAGFWVLVVAHVLTLVAMALHADNEYDRGRIAGLIEGRKAAAKAPHGCVAWWFQGDAIRADRNLRAACAARKSQ